MLPTILFRLYLYFSDVFVVYFINEILYAETPPHNKQKTVKRSN